MLTWRIIKVAVYYEENIGVSDQIFLRQGMWSFALCEAVRHFLIGA